MGVLQTHRTRFLMDEKINLKAVDQYAEAFALNVCDSFFQKKDRIAGPEILTITSIKQVNLLVIRELMLTWKQEIEKSKSPYFDYQAKEVKEALVNYQNILSNHISIARKDFAPLLKRATTHALFLILDPYDFYAETLDRPAGLRVEDLRAELKYIKVNQEPLVRLLDKLSEKKEEVHSGNEAFALLDRILEEVNFTPEELDGFILQFSEVHPLVVEKFYSLNPAPEKKPEKESVAPQIVTEPQKEIKTVADELAKQKSVRIKDNLTINQKFMFTKILFHGDFEIFTEAIDKLDRFDDLKQALKFIDESYPEWDREGEEYEEFMEVVKKRFS